MDKTFHNELKSLEIKLSAIYQFKCKINRIPCEVEIMYCVDEDYCTKT